MSNKVIDNIGNTNYYLPGTQILHREDGPAFISYNGYESIWYRYGKRHNTGGAACISFDSSIHNKLYEWYFNDLLHRIDGPAIYDSSGNTEMWYLHGKIHRIGGPAVTKKFYNGTHYSYYVNGIYHRTDGPAVITPFSKRWYINNLLHRLEGPAIVDDRYGIQEYYVDGKLHRVDGPAVIKGLIKTLYLDKMIHEEWWLKGTRHCTSGPAIKIIGGLEKYSAYYVNGAFLNKSSYKKHDYKK